MEDVRDAVSDQVGSCDEGLGSPSEPPISPVQGGVPGIGSADGDSAVSDMGALTKFEQWVITKLRSLESAQAEVMGQQQQQLQQQLQQHQQVVDLLVQRLAQKETVEAAVTVKPPRPSSAPVPKTQEKAQVSPKPRPTQPHARPVQKHQVVKQQPRKPNASAPVAKQQGGPGAKRQVMIKPQLKLRSSTTHVQRAGARMMQAPPPPTLHPPTLHPIGAMPPAAPRKKHKLTKRWN
eukprot:6491036-Amphidinium_carterae.3